MDIEIRRNRDISFGVTCENPETLRRLFQMTDDQKRLQDFGSQNVRLAPGMTTSKGPDVSWTDVNLREKAHG